MLLTELHLKSDGLKECCESITLVNSSQEVWLSSDIEVNKKISYKLYAIKNVPNYLNVNFNNDKSYSFKKFRSIKGFTMSLGNYSDIDSYMQDQFKTKRRNELFRRIKKLEKSFNINYKCFHGTVDKGECLALLASLKEMIISRFQQRNQVSDSLKNWMQIQTTIHSLIKDKKASLFVIYNEDIPISISICYHYGNVFFSYITSYYIDYYKFGLGNIMLYKKLEWCFKNNYKFLDLGWGELDYKRRWCNHIHNLEHYILFPNNSFPGFLMAIWEGNKTRLKACLLSSKLNKIFKRVIRLIKPRSNHLKTATKFIYENLEYSCSTDGLIPVDLTNEKYSHLKVLKNDFIYRTEEYYSDVKMYSLLNEGVYIIKGKKHCKKVVFIS